MTSLVSIVIPTYNSVGYLCEALDSCLKQTYPHIEIIVVDDGSTDDTGNTLSAHYGSQIHYITQENSGPAIARNRGIEAANGDYIKFLDADDQLHPTCIERCLQIFGHASEKVGVVYTRFRYIDSDGEPLANRQDAPLLNGDIYCDVLLSNGTAILTSTVTVRRNALFDVGLFPDDSTFTHGEDWDLFLRLASNYHYLAIDEILIDYRVHMQNLVHNNYGNAAGRLRVIENAGAYPRTRDCLSEAEYKRLLAGRYHILAMELWKMKRRESARNALQKAIQLVPQEAALRRLYLAMTYFLPASFAQGFNHLIKRVKSS